VAFVPGQARPRGEGFDCSLHAARLPRFPSSLARLTVCRLSFATLTSLRIGVRVAHERRLPLDCKDSWTFATVSSIIGPMPPADPVDTRSVSQFEKAMLVAKLRGARERKKVTAVGVSSRKASGESAAINVIPASRRLSPV
jgi:hypothetical protein